MAKTLRILAAVLLASALLSLAGRAMAQIRSPLRLDTASDDDRKLLRQIDQMAAGQQYDEAVSRLRRLTESRGDALVGIGRRGEELYGYQRYLPLRDVANLRFAEWADSHPEALSLYRRRVDPLAQRWYEEAAANRDEALLRRLVEQAPMSSYGDDALLRLGDIHLERGEFTAARRCWERLAPNLRATALGSAAPAGIVGAPMWLVLDRRDWEAEGDAMATKIAATPVAAETPGYPDTDIALADIRARLVLASIFEGAFSRAELELALFGQLHAEAQGVLAGRSGPYVDLLRELLAQSRDADALPADDDWLTLGGSGRRGKSAPPTIDAANLSGAPIWSHALPPLELRTPRAGALMREDPDVAPVLGYFPLVVGDSVYLNDASRIWGWRLQDGEPVGKTVPPWGDLLLQLPAHDGGAETPLAFTMTSDGRRILARLGPRPNSQNSTRLLREDHSFLVGVDLQTLKEPFGRLTPESGEGEFEGSPVFDDRSLYVLMRKLEAGETQNLYVVCYDLGAGRLQQRWRRWLCGASSDLMYSGVAPGLLSIEGDTLYINTNSGCVAALSTNDGQPRWLLEYPRRPEDAAAKSTSPNPCVIDGGIVFASPSDCENVLAIDAGTGELVWARPLPGNPTAHVLGVGAGNVIVGGDSLCWLDVRYGTLLAQFPPAGTAEPGAARGLPRGVGRGVLVGDLIYWPTHDKIYVFQQSVADAETQPRIRAVREIDLPYRGVTGGNLTVARGVLLLTTHDHIYAFADYASTAASR